MADFDFGFTMEEEVVIDDRAEQIYAIVDPFLEKLKKNPTAQTIKWPNRFEEISSFQAKIRAILDGERKNGS